MNKGNGTRALSVRTGLARMITLTVNLPKGKAASSGLVSLCSDWFTLGSSS